MGKSWNRVGEDEESGLKRTYLWGMDLSGTMQGAGGVGGLLRVRDSGQKYEVTYDGNGNVSEYLSVSGEVVGHYEYDAFGRVVERRGVMSGVLRHGFSTKQRDEETGWSDYGYRYYDAETGRWPSRDPIEEVGGANLYGFVRNDGINAWDLLGQYAGGGYNWTYGKWSDWAPGSTSNADTPVTICCNPGSTVSSSGSVQVSASLNFGALANAFTEAFEVNFGVSFSVGVQYTVTLTCDAPAQKECKQAMVRITYESRSRSKTGTYFGTYIPGMPTTITGTDTEYRNWTIMASDKIITCPTDP